MPTRVEGNHLHAPSHCSRNTTAAFLTPPNAIRQASPGFARLRQASPIFFGSKLFNFAQCTKGSRCTPPYHSHHLDAPDSSRYPRSTPRLTQHATPQPPNNNNHHVFFFETNDRYIIIRRFINSSIFTMVSELLYPSATSR